MKLRPVFVVSSLAALSFAAGIAAEKARAASTLESRIYRVSDARVSSGEWGSIRIYTGEATTTWGTDSMLTAELEFLPGKRLQPPHQHPEEEFQYIIEGSGTWFLNGEETPIQQGDLMYAKPGDVHGIANTGTVPLRFFVMKWKSKDTALPSSAASPAVP